MNTAEIELVQRTVDVEITYTINEYVFLAPSQTNEEQKEVKIWSSN